MEDTRSLLESLLESPSPQDDGDAWYGVYGSVAAFLPCQLRLVQVADGSWRVDQSMMKQVKCAFSDMRVSVR